jgi:carboxypeptidase T
MKLAWVSFVTLLASNSVFAATKYEAVQSYLREIVANNPGNAEIFELGISDSGARIEGLKIGNGETPTIVVGTHHGNEYGSTEVAKATAAELAANPIPGLTTYVIPVLNVGGYNRGQRWEQAGGRSHDPNRDYPGPCGTDGPWNLKSTRALANFIEAKEIVTSATLHTYFPAVVYPWGLSSRDLSTRYDDLFRQLVGWATQESGYQTGNSTEVVYAADGTYEDYAFWKTGVWSLLFELGYTHSPNPTQVKEMIRVNVPGIRRFLDRAPRVRAESHDFTGRCLTRAAADEMDLHVE